MYAGKTLSAIARKPRPFLTERHDSSSSDCLHLFRDALRLGSGVPARRGCPDPVVSLGPNSVRRRVASVEVSPAGEAATAGS
jgi:hypothetical protein